MGQPIHLIAVDMVPAQLASQPTDNPQTETSVDDLAYVIYTSGSTGQPKGIAITHHNVANFLAAMQNEPGLRQSDKLLAVTTISFDIAVLELYLPLVSGASVLIASDDDVTDPAALTKLMSINKIDKTTSDYSYAGNTCNMEHVNSLSSLADNCAYQSIMRRRSSVYAFGRTVAES